MKKRLRCRLVRLVPAAGGRAKDAVTTRKSHADCACTER